MPYSLVSMKTMPLMSCGPNLAMLAPKSNTETLHQRLQFLCILNRHRIQENIKSVDLLTLLTRLHMGRIGKTRKKNLCSSLTSVKCFQKKVREKVRIYVQHQLIVEMWKPRRPMLVKLRAKLRQIQWKINNECVRQFCNFVADLI